MVTALEQEQLSGLPSFNKIQINYILNGPGWYGKALPPPQNDKFVMNINSMAFDAGLSVVYSTLRHELIHVAQYKGKEDSEAAKRSGSAPSSSSAAASSSSSAPAAGSDVLYTNSIINVSEIETHALEIINAKNSGISPEFLKTRAVALQNLLIGKIVKKELQKYPDLTPAGHVVNRVDEFLLWHCQLACRHSEG